MSRGWGRAGLLKGLRYYECMEGAIGTRVIEGGVVTIFVRDMDAAVAFYTEALGLKLKYRAGNHWASIDAGKGLSLGLHPMKPGESHEQSSNGLQLGFDVACPLQEAVEELQSRGVEFPSGIYNDGNGSVRLAFFKDPDGNEHYLCEHS